MNLIPELPQYNRNALEEIVIAGLLIDYGITHIAQNLLEADDFKSASTRIIFEVVMELYEEKIHADCLTVHTRLTKNGTLDIIGGIQYVLEVAEKLSNTANYEFYCHILKEWSIRRKAVNLIGSIDVALADTTADTFDILDNAILELMLLSGRLKAKEEQSNQSIVNEMLDEVKSGKSLGEPITDITSLEEKIQGSKEGDLIIIAGRPGAGKSILLSNIAKQSIKSNENTVIWSLEMTNTEVVKRLVSAISNVSFNKINENQLDEFDIGKLQHATKSIVNSNIKFFDHAGVSAKDIRSTLIRLSAEEPIKKIVIDHGGLLNHINPGNHNSVEEIGNTTKLLKQTAKELNIAVILLWQLNRKAADGKVPTLDDIRGSGRIEEDADKVMFVHRPAVFPTSEPSFTIAGEEYPTDTTVQFVIAKNRRGPIGSAAAYFDAKTFSFSDIRDDHQQGSTIDDRLPWD